MDRITLWIKRQLSNPQVVNLLIGLLGILLIVSFAGDILAPVIASIVLAYLLEGVVKRMTQIKIPRLLAVWLVSLVFVIFLASIVFWLLPILYRQLTEVVQQIPNMLTRGQAALMTLPEHYPELFSIAQVQDIIDSVRKQLTDFSQTLVTNSLASAASLITVVIYVVLLPILIFFLLKDKILLLNWIGNFLPRENELTMHVWKDVDIQIGNYVRGKFWEVLVVWFVTFIAFSYLGIQYSMLLAVLVGLSVIIPYVGAVIVTIPVLAIAWFQWGWNSDFITLVITYLVIQALDGNLLVPLLFSEVVNIHPIAIIVAVLLFGGLWGIWGVFFAIPLATLVRAILLAWPRSAEDKLV